VFPAFADDEVKRRWFLIDAELAATVEGQGTRLVFTEQAVFYDKADGPQLLQLRKQSMTELLGKVAHAIA
jgi:hypothetical protein